MISIKKVVVLLPLSGLFIFNACRTEKVAASQPNVLFIAVDDLRPELNCYGASQINSPHLDQLSAQGVQFNRAYCNYASCGASRASLLTGLRPARNRFTSFDTRKEVDAPQAISLPKIFKENGYHTISNGKVFHHRTDDKAAWDEVWYPEATAQDYALEKNILLAQREGKRGQAYENADVPDSTYKDGKIADKGIRDLKQLKKSGAPFFLALGFVKPHLPFNAPKKYWDLYDVNKVQLPENFIQPEGIPNKAFHTSGELRKYEGIPQKGHFSEEMSIKLIQAYYASVSYVDAQIGRVLTALNEMEISQNTIVVLWGDHGYNLGDHKMFCKHSTFESSLQVPLIIRAPQIQAGQKLDHVVELIDLYPTLCELAGIQPPEEIEGESMVALLQGKKRKKDYAIAKFGDAVAIIRDQFFYTEWTDDRGNAYERMLFDHAQDPLELHNLSEKREYQPVVEGLSSALHQNWGKDFIARD